MLIFAQKCGAETRVTPPEVLGCADCSKDITTYYFPFDLIPFPDTFPDHPFWEVGSCKHICSGYS